MDKDNVVGLAVFERIIIFAVIAGTSITHMGDHLDDVNVKSLGEKMCASHGLEYSHRNYEDTYLVPTIYCKSNSTKLVDGILKLHNDIL